MALEETVTLSRHAYDQMVSRLAQKESDPVNAAINRAASAEVIAEQKKQIHALLQIIEMDRRSKEDLRADVKEYREKYYDLQDSVGKLKLDLHTKEERIQGLKYSYQNHIDWLAKHNTKENWIYGFLGLVLGIILAIFLK